MNWKEEITNTISWVLVGGLCLLIGGIILALITGITLWVLADIGRVLFIGIAFIAIVVGGMVLETYDLIDHFKEKINIFINNKTKGEDKNEY